MPAMYLKTVAVQMNWMIGGTTSNGREDKLHSGKAIVERHYMSTDTLIGVLIICTLNGSKLTDVFIHTVVCRDPLGRTKFRPLTAGLPSDPELEKSKK